MTPRLKRCKHVVTAFTFATLLCGAALTASYIHPIPIGRYTMENACLITSVTTSRIPFLPGSLFRRVTRTRLHIWPAFPVMVAATTALWWWSRRGYPAGHCRQCGYDLTGNESGACSECGKLFRASAL